MSRRRKVFLALMILWMAGIFAFSSRSGDESAEDSYLVGTMVGDLFVPGRSGQISDVILDSAGALAGLLVLTALRIISGRKQQKNGKLI